MVRLIPDTTGRFSQRPHYEPKELDSACEQIITAFLKDRYGEVTFPVSTEDLTILIERDVDDLDQYADLSHLGADVEGVTEFRPGRKPVVKISNHLSTEITRENRLRTTLTHEYGHVKFHAYLWEIEGDRADLWQSAERARHNCRRDDILNAQKTDWMEWQAGYACGALLMPVTPVRRLVGAYQEEHGLFGPVQHKSPHGAALVRRVKSQFQVSEDAAVIRLRKLNLLGDAETPPSLFS